ncbi:MAG TPA: hypothetical protein DCL29_04300 [Eubacterium sp.]|nr:hypothetical protein [Eubacterium sp.]
MKDKLDSLLENAYKERFEPGKDLNDRILHEKNNIKVLNDDVRLRKDKKNMKRNFGDLFTKVAVVAFCVVSIGGIGFFALSKGGINPSSDKKTAKEGTTVVETTSENAETQSLIEEKETEEEFPENNEAENIEWKKLSKKYDFSSIITGKEGTDKDGWEYRELDVSDGGYANVRYYYDSYQEAIEASGLHNILSKDYKRMDREGTICYTDIISLEGTQKLLERSVDAKFQYKNGFVFLTQDYDNHNMEDMSFTDGALQNPTNERVYTSKSGIKFTLRDGTTCYPAYDDEEQVKCTRTSILSDKRKYIITIELRGLSEDEMHEVLDTVVMPDDNVDINKVPASEKRADIVKEIKKNAPKKK